MSNDPTYVNLPLLTTFLKHFERAYLGGPDGHAVQAEQANTDGEDKLPGGMEELVPDEERKTARSLFVNYFTSASKTLVKGQVVSTPH